jgi:hypothetical protein
MQVFTGHARTTPLALMLNENMPFNAFIKAQKLLEVEKLSKAMTDIHAQVAKNATRDRKAAIQKHNDKTNGRSPNLQVGNYVLSRNSAKTVCPSCRSSGRARAVSRVWSPTMCSS